jgi:hypothetical protein
MSAFGPICAKDAYPLGPDIIHSVTNPLSRLTGALQEVYGGDLYGVIRSEWDSETLCEQHVQAAPSVGLFEAANAAMRVLAAEPVAASSAIGP